MNDLVFYTNPQSRGRIAHWMLEEICGEQFTAADVYVGSQLGWGMMFGTIEKRPLFETYVERLYARPAARQANRINEDYLKDRKP